MQRHLLENYGVRQEIVDICTMSESMSINITVTLIFYANMPREFYYDCVCL